MNTRVIDVIYMRKRRETVEVRRESSGVVNGDSIGMSESRISTAESNAGIRLPFVYFINQELSLPLHRQDFLRTAVVASLFRFPVQESVTCT